MLRALYILSRHCIEWPAFLGNLKIIQEFSIISGHHTEWPKLYKMSNIAAWKYNKDPNSFDNNSHIFDSLSTIIYKGNKDSEFTTLFSNFRLDLRYLLNQSVSYVDIIYFIHVWHFIVYLYIVAYLVSLSEVHLLIRSVFYFNLFHHLI